jgi:hypothetical protein
VEFRNREKHWNSVITIPSVCSDGLLSSINCNSRSPNAREPYNKHRSTKKKKKKKNEEWNRTNDNKVDKWNLRDNPNHFVLLLNRNLKIRQIKLLKKNLRTPKENQW